MPAGQGWHARWWQRKSKTHTTSALAFYSERNNKNIWNVFGSSLYFIQALTHSYNITNLPQWLHLLYSKPQHTWEDIYTEEGTLEITFEAFWIGSLWARRACSSVVVIKARVTGWAWLTFTRRGQCYSIRSIFQTDLRLDPLIHNLSLRDREKGLNTFN